MRLVHLAWVFVLCGSSVAAQNMSCNLQDWKGIAGVTVSANRDNVEVSWPGERETELQACLDLVGGPVAQPPAQAS